jgi:hypothetical protein
LINKTVKKIVEQTVSLFGQADSLSYVLRHYFFKDYNRKRRICFGSQKVKKISSRLDEKVKKGKSEKVCLILAQTLKFF